MISQLEPRSFRFVDVVMCTGKERTGAKMRGCVSVEIFLVGSHLTWGLGGSTTGLRAASVMGKGGQRGVNRGLLEARAQA